MAETFLERTDMSKALTEAQTAGYNSGYSVGYAEGYNSGKNAVAAPLNFGYKSADWQYASAFPMVLAYSSGPYVLISTHTDGEIRDISSPWRRVSNGTSVGLYGVPNDIVFIEYKDSCLRAIAPSLGSNNCTVQICYLYF